MRYFSFLVSMLFSLSFLPVEAAVLQVSITGVDKVQGGHLMVGVYDSEATFLKDNSTVAGVRLAVTEAQEGKLVATFDKLALNKKYAIAVFHDVNDNQVLDKNFFGVPKEGYGFSNNARGSFGPPSFDETVILLDKENKAISLYLSY